MNRLQRSFFLIAISLLWSPGEISAQSLDGLIRHEIDGLTFTVSNRNNQWLFGLGAAATWAAHQWDEDVKSYALDRGLMPEPVADFGDIYGGYWAQWILLGAAALPLKGTDLSQMTRWNRMEMVVLATGTNANVTGLLKEIVGRKRPNGVGHRSFPSGHTSNSFVAASVANGLYGKKVGLTAYLAAVIVAGSRIHDNKHYLSDVIAGAILGTAIGRGFVQAYRRDLIIENLSLSPVSGNLVFSVALDHLPLR